jgi:CheY-like chemotaxis protein
MSATKALLVNDDEAVGVIMAEVLEQSAFAVTCATNVVDALMRISSGLYDALLRDYPATPFSTVSSDVNRATQPRCW